MKDKGQLTHDEPEIPTILPVIKAVAPFVLQTEPKPLEIDLQRTAVIVIDMQHTFVSKGGSRYANVGHWIVSPLWSCFLRYPIGKSGAFPGTG